MKKALAILLTLALLLGITGVSFADDGWVTLRVECFDRNITGFDVTNCWQLKYAQENFGDPNKIKLEFVSYSRWDEASLLTTDLAGGNTPDICCTYNGSLVQQYAEFDGLWQLDELLNTYGPNLKEFLGEELLGYGQMDLDGDGNKEQWYLPARRISRANTNYFIRQDLLDKLGMAKPTNMDELTAYLEAVQEQKLGGDNTVAFSFGIYADDPMFGIKFITNTFVDFTQVTEEDWFANARTPEMLPGAKEGLRWLNSLYNKGIISAGFAINDDATTDAEKIMGYNGIFSGQPDQPWRTDKNYQIELEKNVEGGHYVSCNAFYNESLGKYLHDIYAPAGLSVIIPKTVSEDVAIAAIKYLDWMAIPENMFAMQNGIEGINYEGLTEDGIPYGTKSADEVPDENKMHAGDVVFISNGLYYGSEEKNNAALALPFKGYEEDVKAAYVDALTDTWTQISFTVPIQAETDYGATVKSAQGKFVADVVSCAPEKFDEVYDAGIQDILNSGASQMIEEFRAAYQAGNFRGTFPGNN